MLKEEEFRILESFQEGDEAAFKTIFEKYYIPLTRLALQYIPDPMVAEETVQDLFVSLWQNKEKLQVSSSLEAYLKAATRNRSLNYLKSKIHSIHKASKDTSYIQDMYTAEDGELGAKELRGLLEKTLQRLPLQTASVFKLSREAGMSYGEIAAELGMSKKNVEYHISSALRTFREVLKKCGYLAWVIGPLVNL